MIYLYGYLSVGFIWWLCSYTWHWYKGRNIYLYDIIALFFILTSIWPLAILLEYGYKLQPYWEEFRSYKIKGRKQTGTLGVTDERELAKRIADEDYF